MDCGLPLSAESVRQLPATASGAQAQHVQHWSEGEATAPRNLVLLYARHHLAVHHHGWEVTIAADGLPESRPPAWINPDQPGLRQHPPPTAPRRTIGAGNIPVHVTVADVPLFTKLPGRLAGGAVALAAWISLVR